MSVPSVDRNARVQWLRTLGLLVAGAILGGVAVWGTIGGRSPEHVVKSAVSLDAGAALGPDAAAIGSIRVTVDTGVRNGAGTTNPILVWFENRPYSLADDPLQAFRPGQSISAVLTGSAIPRTLGALRRSSILLTMHLDRAQITASWFCDRALIEVRLQGSEEYAPYLEDRGVGWLSLDEPPRRSTAYALQ